MWSGNQSRDSALGTRPDGEKHCNRNQLLRWAEFNECYCLCDGDFSMKPDNTYKGNFLWKRDLIVCSFVMVYYSHFNKFSVIYLKSSLMNVIVCVMVISTILIRGIFYEKGTWLSVHLFWCITAISTSFQSFTWSLLQHEINIFLQLSPAKLKFRPPSVVCW